MVQMLCSAETGGTQNSQELALPDCNGVRGQRGLRAEEMEERTREDVEVSWVTYAGALQVMKVMISCNNDDSNRNQTNHQRMSPEHAIIDPWPCQ